MKRAQDSDLLKGWKEIATYLHCGSEKTAYRWRKSRGLPILTPVSHGDKAPILASKRAIDAWLKGGIEHVFLSNSTLTVLDKQANLLWSHEFPHPLRDYRSEEAAWRLHIVDLLGTGERGVLFAARFHSASIPDTLFWFSSEGEIVWQLDAEPELLNRDGNPLDRAWTYKHVVVATCGKKQVIWAALGNDAGWAGCVLRIEPNGTASVHLANTGYVERVCPVALPEGDFLIVCGENNDFDEAFVAMLGANDPPAVSVPGKRLVYRYANAPSGLPRKYILFPKTELIIARNKPYGHALQIVDHADGVIVEVETGGDGGCMRYHFSYDLEPRYVFPSGSHEFVHGKMEQSGAIDHPWRECPELEKPLILCIWEPDSDWYERPIPWRDNPWKELQPRALPKSSS